MAARARACLVQSAFTRNTVKMANPKVFFDVTIGGSPAGRIVFEVRGILFITGGLCGRLDRILTTPNISCHVLSEI